MLESVELLLTPSCLDCLSWSDDGDLAIAAGENVYILTPKPASSENSHGEVYRSGADQWVITKLQTNLFTNEEWAPVLPQPGEIFSIGEEQSESHVISLSWSPPGLAAYGHCVLGVLTSGLILSLWQSTDGRAQWTRVAVLNHSLHRHFSTLTDDQLLLRQKQRVRAFSWSPVCKISGRGQGNGENPTLRKENERHLIAVCNDVNELLIVDASDRTRNQDDEKAPQADVICLFKLPPLEGQPFNMEAYSLFAMASQTNDVVTGISWGAWVERYANGGSNLPDYVSAISIVRGSRLDVVGLEASIKATSEENRSQLELRFVDWKLSSLLGQALGKVSFSGPASWMRADDTGHISLILGSVEGCISLTLSERDYAHPALPSRNISLQKHTLSAYKTDGQGGTYYDLYPVSGIVHTSDKRSRTLALNVVNFSFHTAPLAAQDGILLSYNVPNQSYETDWRRQVEEFRQQFDLDYDLNGAAMAKIWGLASFRGWIAACFSVHPTGQFEHYTISQHYVRLVFARPFLGTEDESSEADGFSPWQGAKHDPVTQDNGRAVILAFILDPANRETSRNYPSRYKILYAAACCVLVQPVLHSGYLPAAKSAIEFIRDQTRITFATELSLIEETEKNLIAEEAHSLATTGRQTRLRMPAKSQGELSAPGALDVFEICLICGCGMEWYSATESQCAAGHIFPRCGMTFLSIQDPMYTKHCSRCGVEALSDDILEAQSRPESDGPQGTSMLELVLDRFRSCVYCGSKFRS